MTEHSHIDCARVEKRVDKLADAFDLLRDRVAKAETEMVSTTGTINLLRSETASRDGEHTAAIRAMRKDMSATRDRLDTFSTEVSRDISGGFASLQTSLDDLVLKDALREDREKRNTGPIPAGVIAGAVAAPASGVIDADSAKLKAARGWVDLIKSIPPIYVLILLLGCIGLGVTVGVFAIGKMVGWF